MRALLFISLIVLSSCGTVSELTKEIRKEAKEKKLSRKEIRDINRSADYIDKAVRLNPSILVEDTINLPVELEYPGGHGSITAPIASKPDKDSILAELQSDPSRAPIIIERLIEAPCLQEPVNFEDDSLAVQVSMVNGKLKLDYLIKKQNLKGEIPYVRRRLEPTRVEPEPLKRWQLVLMYSGAIFWILMIIGLILRLRRI